MERVKLARKEKDRKEGREGKASRERIHTGNLEDWNLEDWLVTKEKKGNGQRRLSLIYPLLGVDHLVSFDLRDRREE